MKVNEGMRVKSGPFAPLGLTGAMVAVEQGWS